MIKNLKYSLLPENANFSAGYTNLKECLNRPVDVGGCTILFCKSGNANITLNFKPYKVRTGQLLILFGDTVTIPVDVSENFSIFLVSVSDIIIEELLHCNSAVFFDYVYENPLLSTTAEQRNLLTGWEQQLLWVQKPENGTIAYKIFSNSVSSLFMAVENAINNAHKLSGIKYKASQSWAVINNFTKLLFQYGHENRNVNFYADKLCITPGYLYKVVAKIMNTSPKEHIDTYIITEIKVLLSTTTLSVKEIAEELHFEDPSYMCRFFRRRTGVSLTDFRNSNIAVPLKPQNIP